MIKKPGLKNETQVVSMDYDYDYHEAGILHSAYEKILMDAIAGDTGGFVEVGRHLVGPHRR